jgi:predicted RNA-binding Zn-ribbon protein involved in translation (DUF1610 family)
MSAKKKIKCISCGNKITKSSNLDPYICRKCEQEYGTELNRYGYLDMI